VAMSTLATSELLLLLNTDSTFLVMTNARFGSAMSAWIQHRKKLYTLLMVGPRIGVILHL